MSEKAMTIGVDELKRQVAEYTKRQPDYKTYADALKRVLEAACKAAFPEAFVQAREKSVSSFAEKAVRKYATYPDAVNQLNDLCGGRVIVQTLDQVRAVRDFIEANFDIREADEKGLTLGEDKFGYRDMHYLVRLPRKTDGKEYIHDEIRAEALGFTPEEIKAIDGKTAEIQVRTWVQHAWADTLHDRIYKTKLKYPAEFRRMANLLAAIMEDGDRSFNRLADDIDGMLANFNAYAPEDEVERELDVQNLILSTAPDKKKPEIALHIARLVAPRGEYTRVVDELSPYADTASPLGCFIRTELGYALCQIHRTAPLSDSYRLGQAYLQRVVDQCRGRTLAAVPDPRRRVSTLARALARLAWSYEAVDEDAHKARACYREALELEPANPYYLADVIGHEINWLRTADIVGSMASTIRRAIATCQDHIRNGTEMPYAALTAGRLHLLLGEVEPALCAYALGLRHILTGTSCTPADVLSGEERWLILVTKPKPLAGGYRWAMDLLRLAGRVAAMAKEPCRPAPELHMPVLIVAGGATSLLAGQAEQVRPLLAEAFKGLTGTVFSGGTRVGVPGCVGDAAEAVGPRGKRGFKLVGYLPRVRPGDAPEDTRYDECIPCGENSFTPEQILKNWQDIVSTGGDPSAVRLLGFGGGALSAVEYRIALGFGTTVGVVAGSKGAADAILSDDLWKVHPNLLSLPLDRDSIRAFIHPPRMHPELNAAKLERMGVAFHEEYVRNSVGRLPDNMKPWKALKDTFKTANIEQARYSVQILEACGFRVEPSAAPNPKAASFTDEEVERMAEMEHGRWNIERLRNGWRLGARNDNLKRHNCLVPWSELPDGPDGVKRYDRDSVRKFPEILAKAGLEVRRVCN
jgi:ppGpp synthetase/RelA/SpoT-type nucleotidyltranferase